MKTLSLRLLLAAVLLFAEEVSLASGGSRCAITVSTSSTNATCNNSDGSVSVTPTSGIAPFLYRWSSGDSTATAANLAGGMYWVTVTDVNGCSAFEYVPVSSSGSPPPTLSSSGNNLCWGDSAQICAPSGFTSYLWSNGQTGQCIEARLAGHYFAWVTDAGGCYGATNAFILNYHPLPPVSISLDHDTITGYSAVTYQWYFDSVLISGATFATYIVPQSGMYQLGITDTNGCFAMSVPIHVIKAIGNINGEIYQDANHNCVDDSVETGLVNIPIQLWKNGVFLRKTFSWSGGVFVHDIDTFDTYTLTIDTAGLPFIVTCPGSGMDTAAVTALDSLVTGKDFGLECKPVFDLEARSMWGGGFQPARFTTIHIQAGDPSEFYGAHCAAGINGNVTIAIDSPGRYYALAPGALAPSSVAGNVLIYNIADFSTVHFDSDFNIIVQTDTNAVLGSQVCITVYVNPIPVESHLANNVLMQCFYVTGSYDPNSKEVYPAGNVDVNGDHWLTYTVNFQNTGTAEAQHIHITDTLDTDLDASTFQLLAYSHRLLVDIRENTVLFTFLNINLPDSNTNQPASHGYVQYKVKMKNLPVGTEINNKAYIYFDFNAPVVTNTTLNTVAVINSISDIGHRTSDIRIYPNPAGNSVTISVDESMIGGIATVADVTGRKVTAIKLEAQSQKLETQNLADGVYFITVIANNQTITRKLAVNK